MRLLLIERSVRLRHALAAGLRRAGHAVDEVDNGTDGLRQALATDYDVIVLDILLPGVDGLSVVRQLRHDQRDTHLLLLTAKDTVEERIAGLRAGADDCLGKPPVMEELAARVEALARRRSGRTDPVIRLGDLVIDPAARSVSRGGRSVPLVPREFALLTYLADRAGQVVTRADIEAHIYDARAERTSNVIDAAICALRRKIDRPGEPSLILTRRRLGYVLSVPAIENNDGDGAERHAR